MYSLLRPAGFELIPGLLPSLCPLASFRHERWNAENEGHGSAGCQRWADAQGADARRAQHSFGGVSIKETNAK